MTEQLQKMINNELEVLKKIEKEYKTLQHQKVQLKSQFSENEVVKSELDFMKDNEEVYKMIGKVLIKQELTEAKQNVSKRMDYINSETKRIDNILTVTEMKLDESKDKLGKLHKELQQKQISSTGNK